MSTLFLIGALDVAVTYKMLNAVEVFVVAIGFDITIPFAGKSILP